MKWLYNRPCWKEKGFTLIELLIVIIILAVLAGIAIPGYLTIANRAKKSATQAELSSVAVALEIYNADNNGYPVSVLDTIAAFEIMSKLLDNITANPSDLVYMNRIPLKDKWAVGYTYGSDGTTYTMTSTGGSTVITFIDGQMTDIAK